MDKVAYFPITNISDIKRAIFAGRAVITIENGLTGKWFTYRISESKKCRDLRHWVNVLTGNDNTHSYTYMGTIYGGKTFRLNASSRIGAGALSFKAFDRFFHDLMYFGRLNENMHIYHSGVCARCGRTLTVPESLTSGIGPECAKLTANSIYELRKKKLEKFEKKND